MEPLRTISAFIPVQVLRVKFECRFQALRVKFVLVPTFLYAHAQLSATPSLAHATGRQIYYKRFDATGIGI